MSNHRAATRFDLVSHRFRRVWSARIARHQASLRDASAFAAGSVVTMIAALLVFSG